LNSFRVGGGATGGLEGQAKFKKKADDGGGNNESP